jgi:putative transposase
LSEGEGVSFWRCHYHLIWTTWQRHPAIDAVREGVIARCVASIANEQKLKLHAVGIVEDHMHVVISIPPRLAVASVVQQFKGSSSNQLGKANRSETDGWPGWQSEYGVLTFGEASFDRIVSYVANQKEHHRNQTRWAPLEQFRADQPGIGAVSP